MQAYLFNGSWDYHDLPERYYTGIIILRPVRGVTKQGLLKAENNQRRIHLKTPNRQARAGLTDKKVLRASQPKKCGPQSIGL
jgi:hypothetical protein